MNILLFLIPVSLVLLLVALWAFRWAVRRGQFENLDAAAIDILRDDSADAGPDATDVEVANTRQHDGSPVVPGNPGRAGSGSRRAD